MESPGLMTNMVLSILMLVAVAAASVLHCPLLVVGYPIHVIVPAAPDLLGMPSVNRITYLSPEPEESSVLALVRASWRLELLLSVMLLVIVFRIVSLCV